MHEKCMVALSTEGSHFDSVHGIPSCIAINHNAVTTMIKVLNCELLSHVESLLVHRSIILIPVDCIAGFIVFDNTVSLTCPAAFL